MQTAQLEKQLQDLSAQTPKNFVNPTTGMQIPYPWAYQNFMPQNQINEGLFAEPTQNGFSSMGGALSTKVQSGNLVIMVLGAIFAGTIGGYVNKFFPVGAFAPVVGGLLLRMILKSGKGRDFANGVLIGGAASALSGTIGGLFSGLGFAEKRVSAPARVGSSTMAGVRF